MDINKIRQAIAGPDYNFLREDPHLGKNIILLGLGGSYAYGMDREDSDIDLRGIALNTKHEILLGDDFAQIVEINTDTTVYSLRKITKLLLACNPNTIEMLGLMPEQYLWLSDVGRELLGIRKAFLSKYCIHAFGGYAGAQLRRMENKTARKQGQAQREKHILNSIENARYSFASRYFPNQDGSIRLYIDKSEQEGYETEIFMDVHLSHYPLRDWCGMWNEMKQIVSSYSKIGMRNRKAMEHNKLGKHMAHLLRLYMMCIDILTKEEIITYRRDEHDLLMSIRNGDFIDQNGQPDTAFYDLLDEYEKKMEDAVRNTSLPDEPDYELVTEFLASVNKEIVKENEDHNE